MQVPAAPGARRCRLLASYTLGKSTDDASGFFTSAGDPNFPQNSLDPGAERGRSSFDVRHRFSASFAYDLAARRGNVVAATDWRAAGQWSTLQSGRPFTVALHARHRRQQHRPVEPRVRLQRSAERHAATPSLSSRRRRTQWFNTAAFSMPAFGTFGNAGRNIAGRARATRTSTWRSSRPCRVGRRVRLQLRAEAFNLFNRANLDLPDAFLGSPTFGQILSAGSPRRIQFGVRAVF